MEALPERSDNRETMIVAKRHNPPFLFLSLVVSVSVLASFIAHSSNLSPLAPAASLDLTLTVPAAWYLLVVRPGLRARTTVIFVALSGLWRAAILFPHVVPGKMWIGAGLEMALIASVLVGLRQSAADSEDADPVDRLRDLVARITFSRVAAAAIATEFAVFYYAFAWKPKPHVPPGMRGFSMHERSGSSILVLSLAFLSLIEIVPVHLMVKVWSPTAAWIATGLSIWGAIWMIAMSRAFALRPMLAGSESIVVRYGLVFRLGIPVDRIQSIYSCSVPEAGVKIVPHGAPASVYIRFSEPLEAELLPGFTKTIGAIGLSADDAAGFADAILALTTGRSAEGIHTIQIPVPSR